MTTDLTGCIQAAVRLYTERARALYAASIGASYAPPTNDEEAITRACEATAEFARSLVEMHEPPPNPADFGIHESAPQQETTMHEPSPTAATIRAAHSSMEAAITAAIREQVRIFERETGLEVQGVEVQLATLTSPAGRETFVDSVDVRVGLGR